MSCTFDTSTPPQNGICSALGSKQLSQSSGPWVAALEMHSPMLNTKGRHYVEPGSMLSAKTLQGLTPTCSNTALAWVYWVGSSIPDRELGEVPGLFWHQLSRRCNIRTRHPTSLCWWSHEKEIQWHDVGVSCSVDPPSPSTAPNEGQTGPWRAG